MTIKLMDASTATRPPRKHSGKINNSTRAPFRNLLSVFELNACNPHYRPTTILACLRHQRSAPQQFQPDLVELGDGVVNIEGMHRTLPRHLLITAALFVITRQPQQPLHPCVKIIAVDQ